MTREGAHGLEPWHRPAALFSRDVRFRQTRFAINRVTRSGVLELHVEPSVLPKSVDGGNLGCNKLVIRWLPV